MSIGVEGQYLYRFDIGGREDFIDEDDLIEFTLIEEVGNVLPTFQLAFSTRDNTILGLLHENNDFKVSFGKDRDSLTDAPLVIAGLESSGLGSDKTTIYMSGILAAMEYATDSKLSISEPLSAIEVMRNKVSRYFVPDFNLSKSLDSQRWIQPNTSDKKFVNELWLHTDLGTSFPAVGISTDQRFIVRDVKKTLGASYTWRMTKNGVPTDPRDIIYDDDYTMKTSTGFINSWVGYGRERFQYNLEDDQNSVILNKIDPIVALTTKVARREEVEKRFASVAPLSDNMHDNYWTSFDHNLVNLAVFGTVRMTMSFQNEFKAIRVLDPILFIDTENSQLQDTATYHTGLYLTCKVARTVAKRQFVTTVQICRESLNELKDAT